MQLNTLLNIEPWYLKQLLQLGFIAIQNVPQVSYGVHKHQPHIGCTFTGVLVAVNLHLLRRLPSIQHVIRCGNDGDLVHCGVETGQQPTMPGPASVLSLGVTQFCSMHEARRQMHKPNIADTTDNIMLFVQYGYVDHPEQAEAVPQQ